MKLEKNDYYKISDMLELGTNQLEYRKGDECLVLDYDYTEEGILEDDYYKGTGSFVVTSRSVCLNDVYCLDHNGDIICVDFDSKFLKKIVS